MARLQPVAGYLAVKVVDVVVPAARHVQAKLQTLLKGELVPAQEVQWHGHIKQVRGVS
jgi:hypothetical protein